jgi:hypothetical protein
MRCVTVEVQTGYPGRNARAEDTPPTAPGQPEGAPQEYNSYSGCIHLRTETQMAILQNRVHWMAIAFVAAILTWNLSVSHVAARGQPPHYYPFSSGDTVSLGFIPDGMVSCVVGEIRGTFLKCAPAKETITFNRPPQVETWYNLTTVKYIDKAAATR